MDRYASTGDENSRTPECRAVAMPWRESGQAVNPSLACIVMALLVLALLLTSTARADVCDGQGNAVLVMESERVGVGQRVPFTLHGKRLSRLSILADVGAGPVTLPNYGTFCLDLGPQLRIVEDGIRQGSPRIRAGGFYQFEIRIPNRRDLLGRRFHIQAAIQDDDAPNGIAISNMVEIYLDATVVEDFTTTEFRGVGTSARWESDGACSGVFRQRTTTATPGPQTVFRLSHPLVSPADPSTPNGCRFQMRFTSSEVGAVAGDYLIGMNWSPRSGFTFQSTYSGLSILLSDFAGSDTSPLSKTFNSNYGTPPVTVFQGEYQVSNGFNQTWFPWPVFSTPYALTPGRPLLFEVDLPVGGTTYQLFYNRSVAAPHNRNFANSGASQAPNSNENTTYYTQFLLQSDTSVAESTYYDTQLLDPDYGEAVIDASVPDGTQLSVMFRGGRDVDDDGIPDIESNWVGDLDDLDGYRFVRFRIDFVGDRTAGVTPTVNAVTMTVAPRQ